MKKAITLFMILFIFISLAIFRQPVQARSTTWLSSKPGQGVIDPALQASLDELQAEKMVTVIVTLRQQADLSGIPLAANRTDRLQELIQALRSNAASTQGPLIDLLNTRRSQGLVSRFTPFWIFNGFSVTATGSAIQELANRPDVFSITSDDIQIVPVTGQPEQNIDIINAPALWNLGFSGQGVVVASMDTGVDVSHPDLTARWRGGSNSWYDPFGQHPTTPTDLSGHGTETTGIMVGGDVGGTSIGAAPNSSWIAVKIFNDSGNSTATAIHLGYQWLLDPDGNLNTDDAPQVVNNSWAYANPGCYLDFELDLHSLAAAGIVPVFAAGNGGPSANSSYSPANNPSAFAVGATDNADQIYSFSSQGPTSCGGSTGPFPEVVAPGVNIKTSALFGSFVTDSGTSFAAPHVSGSFAVLLSAFPNRSVSDLENAIIITAIDLGSPGPDDVFGYGRLDLLAAYNWLATAPTATPVPTSTPFQIPTFTPTPMPTATPTQPPATSLHIGDLDRSSSPNGSKWNAVVTILVHDTNHTPIANAAVSGKWSNGASGTASCTTNSSGLCQVTKSGLNSKTASVKFSITNLSRSGFAYSSAANHDPDGDSSGTVIIVNK